MISQRLYPVCVGGRHRAPPEDCGGARVYSERVDPRWRQWCDTWPRNEFQTAIDVLQKFLDPPDKSIQLGEVGKLRAAVTAGNEHRKRAPDEIDRRTINQRLQRYATGDRQWLFL